MKLVMSTRRLALSVLVAAGLVVASTAVVAAQAPTSSTTTSTSSTTSTSTTSTSSTTPPTYQVVLIDVSSPLQVGPSGSIHVEGTVTGWGCPSFQGLTSWYMLIGIAQPTIPGAPGYGLPEPLNIDFVPPGAVDLGVGDVGLPCSPDSQSWATDVTPPDGHPFRNGPAVVQAFEVILGHAHYHSVSDAFPAVIVGAAEAAAPAPVTATPRFTG